MPSPSDSRTVHRIIDRRLAAAGLVAGPALFLLAAGLAPAFTVAPEEADAYLDRVAAAPGAHLLSAVLFLIGATVLVPGVLGISHLLQPGRFTIGRLAVALVTLGVLTIPGFYVLNVVQLAMADPAADRRQMATLFERIEESIGLTVLLAAFAVGTVVGLLLLALTLLRARAVPVWGALALLAAVAVGFLPDAKPASIVEFALLLVGTTAIARRMWSDPAAA